jgi:flagellar biosynthesis protein FlhA
MSTATLTAPDAKGGRSDGLMPVVVLGILGLMVLPVPAGILDALLALNIVASVAILLTSLHIKRPLDFSTFPALLLVTTLLRLGLNISTTRLILLNGAEGTGAAGHVIETFGKFVVGGNYVVGAVIFLILLVINFIVITKGSGRIAEVAARFTLDAMPGRQMAIDADLAAGNITPDEARRRREDVTKESDFYAAMDGANKFVRGDAIAAIIITVINVVGGLVVGVLDHGLPVGVAAKTYSLLTIGDGLVSQIPALIVSTAAGLIVTRSSDQRGLGTQVMNQALANPAVLNASTGVAVAMAFVPGLPVIPFLALAGALQALKSNNANEAKGPTDNTPRSATTPEEARAQEEADLDAALPVEILELRVGYSLVPLVTRDRGGGELLDRIVALRKRFAGELGIKVPPVTLKDSLEIPGGDYRVLVNGVVVAQGSIMTDRLLAMDPGNAGGKVNGIATKDPAFGIPALWIQPQDRDRAEMYGFTVVEPVAVIATHLSEVFREHAAELVGRAELQSLIDIVARRHPRLVDDLIPSVLSLAEVHGVIRGLLRENISVRDLRTIIEALGDAGRVNKHPAALMEAVRLRLGPSIAQTLAELDGKLYAALLEPDLEAALRKVMVTSPEPGLAPDLATAQRVLSAVQKAVEKLGMAGKRPILVAPSDLRYPLWKFIHHFLPQVVVVAQQELPSRLEISAIASVGFERRAGHVTAAGASHAA